MIKSIIKRDGRSVPYNVDKISKAIYKAAKSVGGADLETAEMLAGKVESQIEKNIIGRDPSIEEIQDMVEKVLIENGHARTAKAYILYRAERTRVRESSTSLMKTFEDLTFSSAIESDTKRENANINGDTAMGTMLKYGSEGAKKFNSLNVLDPVHAKAHAEGDIHVHDLDFYTLTTTCCQIDLTRLFEKGFSTGHGHLRTPNSIQSYAALACIAIQSNQNDQHGGQSIPAFDHYMAAGVAKTFRSCYASNLAKLIIQESHADIGCYPDTLESIKRIMKSETLNPENMPRLQSEHNKPYRRTEALELERGGGCGLKMETISALQLRAGNIAEIETDRATYQAMEALVHNLNTMNSRAGAQVPFSSINYGTDTSPEGRMVTRNLLLATEAGLGNGETPIFPVQIFKVKSGVNYDPGDPNYDLFKLAIETSAKRMFPNFSFLDAPFNLKYYKPNHPETEIGYMGCVDRYEIVTYKIDGKLYVEGIGRAWDRFEKAYGANSYGESEYVDLENENVLIYDTHANDFVKVKKWIKNPDKKNWLQIKLTNGRNLRATADHPLPTKDRGRVYASDLTLHDQIPIVYKQFSPDDKKAPISKLSIGYDSIMSKEEAWLLGLILCDASYASNITISLGNDESDIIQYVDHILEYNIRGCSVKTSKIYQNRGQKGSYVDVSLKCGGKLKETREMLAAFFEGWKKNDRHIPNEVFSWPDHLKYAFIAGMMDADGYVNKSTGWACIGSTNKELALQQMALLQSVGVPAKCYINHYRGKNDNAVRVRIEFGKCDKIIEYMQSGKKICAYEDKAKPGNMQTHEYGEVAAIERSGYEGPSFDVETESDRFDVSGILSHNCRTRVMGNVHDPSREITPGRGNLSFTTINLPRLAIEAEGDIDKFYASLRHMMDLVSGQLMHRYRIMAKKTPRNFPFLMQQGVWIDSDTLDIDDDLEDILKHGTLSIGFIGLAETLIALVGEHHGESEKARALGLEIIRFMREYTDNKSESTGMNFTLLATPAEGLSGRFIAIDKKRYGEIPGITDKDFYTNSFHVPVYYNISAFKKISIEAPYHELTNAGHISYIELDGDPSKNLEAFERIIRHMHDSNIGYGAINHPLDRDPVCGFNGVIDDICPCCGRHESEIITERFKRPKL